MFTSISDDGIDSNIFVVMKCSCRENTYDKTCATFRFDILEWIGV